MTRRAQSIQTKIIVLLIAPITALVVLWAYAATVTSRDSLRQVRAETFDAKVVKPTSELIAALQDERRMSVAHLGDDATIGRAGLDAQRAKTDRIAALYRKSATQREVRAATTPEAWRQMAKVVDLLGRIGGLRGTIDGEQIERSAALGRYTELIDEASVVFDEVYPDGRELVEAVRALVALERAREHLAREDALVTGALAAGTLTELEYLQFMRSVGAQRFLFEEAARALPAAVRGPYRQIVTGREYGRFRELEDRLMTQGGSGKRPPVDVGEWRTTTEAVSGRLADLTRDLGARTSARTTDQATGVLIRLSLAGGLGLLAIAISIGVAFRVGRRMIRESRDVAASMHTFTSERLPRIAELARTGREVTDDQPPGGFTISEINQIDRAFTEARRAVVRSGTSEARAHQRLGEILINLARRNQVLLQRLLGMLETMQQHVEDPDQLERLYELDHIATRMRRHAEGLVILSGRPAGRTWRQPVRLIDVARAASSEVEDYTRVEVIPMPRVALQGRAVADVIHLLAELIENALAFSPSENKVRVTGQEAAHGFVVEVEDRGLGMTPEMFAEVNERLHKPSEGDFHDSARLGFSVVTRLAERHDIKVTLRGSPYGGVLAIVLIPSALLADATASALPEASRTTRPQPLPLAAADSPATASGGTPILAAPALAPPVASVPATRGSGEIPASPASRTSGETRKSGETRTSGEIRTSRESGETVLPGLPTRRRQENLAPQLRKDRTTGSEDPSPSVQPAEPSSPERARSLMSAMQRGWQRGRAESARPADGTGPNGTGPNGTGPNGTGPNGTGPNGSGDD